MNIFKKWVIKIKLIIKDIKTLYYLFYNSHYMYVHVVVAMTILSEDYSKFVLLESNRTLEFHVQVQ